MWGIRDGNIEQAVNECVGDRYTQHSVTVKDGKQGFIDFFKPFLERNPDRDMTIVRIWQDGPIVFCQAYQSLNGGAAKWCTMDIFDFDDQDRIVEHWDTIFEYTKTASGEDMVGGPTEPTDLDKTDANKALCKEFVKNVLNEGQFDQIDKFMAEDLIQHNMWLKNGRAAFKEGLESGNVGRCQWLFRLIGCGNFVVAHMQCFRQGKEWCIEHLYRVADGKIVEMWEGYEEIAPRETWNNSGKF